MNSCVTSRKFPKQKVHVIRNGVDCDRFQPCRSSREDVRRELGLPLDTPLIGIVAALRHEKNHGMLVQTAARIRHRFPEAHWIVVGDGPEKAAIESLIAELEIGDRVHLLGTRHDTPRLVAALDVFTLCSVNEASPVSILEALACGIPAIATNVGSVRESIVQGVTGLLVPSQDVEAMTAAVDKLLSDPAMRREMGAAGRNLVLQSGSLESMVEGYQQLMATIYDSRVGNWGERATESQRQPRRGLTLQRGDERIRTAE